MGLCSRVSRGREDIRNVRAVLKAGEEQCGFQALAPELEEFLNGLRLLENDFMLLRAVLAKKKSLRDTFPNDEMHSLCHASQTACASGSGGMRQVVGSPEWVEDTTEP